jgi:hypothetical protein
MINANAIQRNQQNVKTIRKIINAKSQFMDHIIILQRNFNYVSIFKTFTFFYDARKGASF